MKIILGQNVPRILNNMLNLSQFWYLPQRASLARVGSQILKWNAILKLSSLKMYFSIPIFDSKLTCINAPLKKHVPRAFITSNTSVLTKNFPYLVISIAILLCSGSTSNFTTKINYHTNIDSSEGHGRSNRPKVISKTMLCLKQSWHHFLFQKRIVLFIFFIYFMLPVIDISRGEGGALVFEVGYHPRKKIPVIRVVFQDQAMYARTSIRVQKHAKLEKRCVFGHITNFGKDMMDKLKRNACKSMYLGSIFILEKYVFRMYLKSPFTRMISNLKYKCPPRGSPQLDVTVHMIKQITVHAWRYQNNSWTFWYR